jgi:hypothetical protein
MMEKHAAVTIADVRMNAPRSVHFAALAVLEADA